MKYSTFLELTLTTKKTPWTHHLSSFAMHITQWSHLFKKKEVTKP